MPLQYIVLEIQTNANGNVGTLVTAYADQMQAESKYHTILAAAAISTLPRHAAALLTSDGALQAAQSYEHAAE